MLWSEQAGGGGALAACGDASWYCLRLRGRRQAGVGEQQERPSPGTFAQFPVTI